MLNRQLLTDRVNTKFRNQIFSEFVNEAFIQALPFSGKSILDEGLENFQQYGEIILESLGGFELLEKAKKNKDLPKRTREIVTEMYDVISELANAFTKRAISQIDFQHTTAAFEDVVEDTVMQEDESSLIDSAKKELRVDMLADAIKEKVIQTIREERNAYQEEQNIEKEIADVLAIDELKSAEDMEKEEDTNEVDSNDVVGDPSGGTTTTPELTDQSAGADTFQEDQGAAQANQAELQAEDTQAVNDDGAAVDETGQQAEPADKEPTEDEELIEEEEAKKAVESYFKTYFGNKYARNYISLFSKLNDVALEAVMFSKEETFGEIPFNTLLNVTLEHTLNVFDKKMVEENALESATLYALEDFDSQEPPKQEIQDKAAVCAIIIYTLFETLNTMGIFAPSKEDIKYFLESPTDAARKIIQDGKTANDVVDEAVSKLEIMINNADSPDTLKGVIYSITQARNKLAGVSEWAASKFQGLIEKAEEKLGKYEEVIKPEAGYFDQRDKSELVGELNKLAIATHQKPMVKVIRIIVDKDSKDLNVECCDDQEDIIEKRKLPVRFNPAFGSALDMVKEAFIESLFQDDRYADKLVEIIH